MINNTITAEQAWLALGADPRYRPKRPQGPANGPALWRLNLHDQLLLLPSPPETSEQESDDPGACESDW